MAASDAVPKTFTATGQSTTFSPLVSDRSTKVGRFNVFLKPTAFVGTIQLERTPAGDGTNWYPIGVWTAGTFIQLSKYVFAGTETNSSEEVGECEPGALYRLNCTAYTSGTIDTSMEGAR